MTSEGSEQYQIGPKSFRINLVSFRASRGPLLPESVSWFEPFFAVPYYESAQDFSFEMWFQYWLQYRPKVSANLSFSFGTEPKPK